jgi:hypothetical protein
MEKAIPPANETRQDVKQTNKQLTKLAPKLLMEHPFIID